MSDTRVQWTDTRLLALWQMRMAGYSDQHLADLLGVSRQRVNQVVRAYADRSGLPAPGNIRARQLRGESLAYAGKADPVQGDLLSG